jgi:hypothetical protein
MAASPIEKRIRRAALLICVGLIVQLLCLNRTYPLTFMTFLVVGCPLMLAGVVLFLYSLVAEGES